MTSEVDALKTNEFIRRRKLRIQQVREQSKDIAKKIRQRANAEKFQHLVNLDATKEKEYLDQQDKLIKKLELLHAKSIRNLGTGHKNAAEATQQENKQEKVDLSKQRVREAATALRQQKQVKIDERKKLLDRKLQAREIANKLSREKSSIVANKLAKTVKIPEEIHKASESEVILEQTSPLTIREDAKDKEVVTNDMATQWGPEPLPNEWEPNIPIISLPKEDTSKEHTPKTPDDQLEKSKRPNLFALSDEMPSSLRGGLTETERSRETNVCRPSLTLVSDYIQQRDLRLRDFDSKPSNKRSTEDLQKLKQTILRTRATKAEVSAKSSKCDRPNKQDSLENLLAKKSSVTMYNHSTRDMRDVPFGDRNFVLRDHHNNEDAYSQAMKETSIEQLAKEKEHQKKLQDMRNKIAMTKQSVEKEYKDTMSFLKSLSKDKDKPIKTAYKDAQQEQILKEYKQRKMQHEFRKIQRESRKQAHPTVKQCSKVKFARMRNSDHEDNFDSQDLQYSWMPVPESDKGLAVHIIPTKIKEQKSGNTVKFSKIDSYHEYRSRHKHTPPTKDTCGNEQPKIAEPEFFDDPDTETSSSSLAEGSSVKDLRLGRDKETKSSDSDKCSEAERIIIYKILDSKSDKRAKVKKKSVKTSVSKSLGFTNKEEDIRVINAAEDLVKEDKIDQQKADNLSKASHNHNLSSISPKYLKEGVYKTVKQKGDNISFMRYSDEKKQQNPPNVNMSEANVVDRGCGSSKEIDVGEPTSESPRGASSSSFKTASNDKRAQQQQVETEIGKETGLPSGGLVKVVDEKGQDSGKFFIGATGFLKDDEYEVIIKLRKTDTIQADKKDTQSGDSKSEQTTTAEPEKTPASMQTTATNPDFPNKMTVDVGCGDEVVNITDLNTKDGDMNVATTSQSRQHNLVDKEVDVTLEDHAFYHKVNSDKQATSVSVQTTLDSPELRYHRMSSSTSTAYLSPPEVILPKYLNRDDNYKRYMHYASRNPKVYIVNHEPQPHLRRTSVKSKTNASPSPRVKNVQRRKPLKTPPNTARSCISENSRSPIYSPCKKRNTPIIVVPKTVRKRRCSKTCLKSHFGKMKRALSSNLVAPPSSMQNTNARNSRTDGLGVYGFNPVIKQYVDKLLQMNKEGVKAIEVLNQDCSSVTTPGSSVIEDFNNIDQKNRKIEPNISLEQLKQLVAQHIMKKCAQDLVEEYENQAIIGDNLKVNSRSTFRFPKKRSIHKVKSLNISRSVISKKVSPEQKQTCNGSSSCPVSGTSSKDDIGKSDGSTKQKHRSKSSPSPRRPDIDDKEKLKTSSLEGINETESAITNCFNKENNPSLPSTRKSVINATASQDSEPVISTYNSASSDSGHQSCLSLHTSTQTNRNIDADIHYIKLAEDKLQNMEKIADLTEKCTQRLSNLAKVLEEVRRNKLSYSHASESASDTDQVSGQNSENRIPVTTYEPIIEIKEKETLSPPSERIHSPPTCSPTRMTKEVDKSVTDNKKDVHVTKRPKSPSIFGKTSGNIRSPNSMNSDHHNFKSRGKPPPALVRCLKRTQEYVVPHELSTVVEVDSPISSKYKSRSSRSNAKYEGSIGSESEKEKTNNDALVIEENDNDNEPDLIETNNAAKHIQMKNSDYSTEDSKMQMMDLKQFNDIMLKPFISIQEYAKQCNMTKLEEGSNVETLLRGDAINDEMSSLHSDGSLPDVIAELLKRNIISEPFKFDTASNINSTTVSSDSTLSVLALSKVKRSQRKTSVYKNKENMEETSDTLSNSSNPDLENAFKKLGMGWASSTLKKTKEHLALSSSSTNTSTSSLSQYKIKSVRSKDFPALVTDSISSIRNATKITGHNEQNGSGKLVTDGTKTTGQQTSLASSFTVKQFLTNELAKKITFSSNTRKNDTEEEFVSLCETKMPEDMQRAAKYDERSFDSSNPRARTSTPVQIFRSTTYHTSSSSNLSNGLFSNADDLSSVKGTSNSLRNHSTSEKDDLTIPNFSLRTRKGLSSDCSRSDE